MLSLKLLVLTCQKKNPMSATVTSKVARIKNKSSTAATNTSEEPPSPEDGTQKCSPEELIEEDKPKQKLTTL